MSPHRLHVAEVTLVLIMMPYVTLWSCSGGDHPEVDAEPVGTDAYEDTGESEPDTDSPIVVDCTPPSEPEAMVDNGNGAVTDPTTGLEVTTLCVV